MPTIREQLRDLDGWELLNTLFDPEEEEALELHYIKKYERDEGRKEGRKRAMREIKNKMIRNMLKKNLSLDLISEISDTSIEEIKQIEQKLLKNKKDFKCDNKG